MKKVKLYTLLAGLILFASCKKFLDKQPPHNLTLDNAVTDYAGAKNVLNGMYGTVQNQNLGGALMVPLSAMAGFYTGDYAVNYTMATRQGDKDYGDRWIGMYSAINAANAAIISISALSDNQFPAGLPSKKSMVAEARLYRAWNYSWLLWTRCHWWSTPENPNGLIYRDKMANLSNLQVARLTVGASYDKIFEDIDDAIANAPSYTSSKYLSKEMAMVLKAKLLLYRGKGSDYTEALKLVQALKPKAFIEPNVKKLYEDAWDSKEVLWSRYLESPGRTLSEFAYSYGIIYNHKFNLEFATGWLAFDPRYPEVTGIVRSPEAWDDRTFPAFTKLAHRGRVTGPEDNYATYYFRWSELYLMEAELIARTGGTVTDALKPINAMRAAKTSVVLPALTASSLNEFYDVLFKEIWVELALENGSEWFASLRFMKDGRPWVYSLKKDVNFDENKYIWPIPDAEMISNKLATQNPDLK
ncbi:SusD family protein [Pedobacter sp. ok626]|uniref:RagB/SusD family nutrient uptake outer membrane protein n=1 Tax=Pedobacter sp. ok626 TaxID=1761882 RepID=UPI0008876061|nr:RagB/SusD family nutrient uptake outer membrane protein [Pedobacter sp. ok626]SDJ94440.1 SusD family protein [Pedobacter sp. ok626]